MKNALTQHFILLYLDKLSNVSLLLHKMRKDSITLKAPVLKMK